MHQYIKNLTVCLSVCVQRKWDVCGTGLEYSDMRPSYFEPRTPRRIFENSGHGQNLPEQLAWSSRIVCVCVCVCETIQESECCADPLYTYPSSTRCHCQWLCLSVCVCTWAVGSLSYVKRTNRGVGDKEDAFGEQS